MLNEIATIPTSTFIRNIPKSFFTKGVRGGEIFHVGPEETNQDMQVTTHLNPDSPDLIIYVPGRNSMTRRKPSLLDYPDYALTKTVEEEALLKSDANVMIVVSQDFFQNQESGKENLPRAASILAKQIKNLEEQVGHKNKLLVGISQGGALVTELAAELGEELTAGLIVPAVQSIRRDNSLLNNVPDQRQTIAKLHPNSKFVIKSTRFDPLFFPNATEAYAQAIREQVSDTDHEVNQIPHFAHLRTGVQEALNIRQYYEIYNAKMRRTS